MMEDLNKEEELKKLIRSAYQPVTPSPEFRTRLLASLTSESRDTTVLSRTPWSRPQRLVPVAAAVIAVVIGYGIWLSLTYPLS